MLKRFQLKRIGKDVIDNWWGSCQRLTEERTGARKRTACVIPGSKRGQYGNLTWYGPSKILCLESGMRKGKIFCALGYCTSTADSNYRGEIKGKEGARAREKKREEEREIMEANSEVRPNPTASAAAPSNPFSHLPNKSASQKEEGELSSSDDDVSSPRTLISPSFFFFFLFSFL